MKNICMISFGNLEAPRNGYVLRCWMLAQRLVKEGNRVTVYQFSDVDNETSRDGISIHSIGVSHERPSVSKLEKIFGFNPTREIIFPFEGYRKLNKYKSQLADFDEIYIESCMLMNAMAVTRPLGVPITIDTHCMNKDVALKLMKQNKFTGSIRVVIWHLIESTMLRRANKVIAISENDKIFMQHHYHVPDSDITVIPHVVDPAAADKYEAEAHRLKSVLSKGYGHVVCFVGDLGAIQNIESEKFIRERLAPAFPDIHFVLIGNNPKDMQSNGNITYTGFVDAVDPYVMSVDICIAPMAVGSGIKTKVLDYLKYDKPIIATPVAVEGIDPSAKTIVCELSEFKSEIENAIERM